MSASAALQIALIDALRASAGVTASLGQRIWDNAPDEATYPYLTLGPAQELDDSAECIDGVECLQQLDIWTKEDGSQLTAKMICGAVKKALHGADLELNAPYALSAIVVESQRVVGDPDEKISHGIVSVRASIEEEG
ncbi:DUF3168 domain-containing protein [Pseudogemmobacter faecipullorum]|uniref:DUF3168 domain-containing protein n=1 Tax=Pseudogemmobacter faecipullorum TaxID=2755041 RepID=A0ABS8CQ49_9RHOB|nr:DUF3168 domain-containing protein [Pseudogemmobacter faecipullorum]MCB5411315.1 DUF3168 domain-containing protein [Pseudogemmobacter faecipullorum]